MYRHVYGYVCCACVGIDVCTDKDKRLNMCVDTCMNTCNHMCTDMRYGAVCAACNEGEAESRAL